MMLSSHQKFCLKQMGITIWEHRSAATITHAFLFNEILTREKRELIVRIQAALKWSTANTCVLPIQDFNTQTTTFRNAIQKILSCGVPAIEIKEVGSETMFVQIPTLENLLKDVEAKRVAWKAMQLLL